MGFSPTQGLRSFATSQPPLLVFTICLMAFGLTMVVLAYLIGENELPNPDIRMDWNKFLQKMTELDICVPQKHLKNLNSSQNQHQQLSESNGNINLANLNATNNSSFLQIVDHRKSLSAFLSDVVDQVTEDTLEEDSTYVNISIKVRLWISGDMNALITSYYNLSGAIEGKQLGLIGKLSSQIVNVSFSFPPLYNISCEKWCHISREVCLTLHLSSALLPHTKSPEKCQVSESDVQESISIDFIKSDGVSSEGCNGGRRLNLEYTPDTKLTEMLSIHERSIVNLHLMHTSYFMFVMVMTLLCYALIKGRYRSPKTISMEKIPLDA